MTHSEEESTALALLSQLSNLSLSQPQGVVASLKRLKHELIGHDQKKDLFVRLGIVPPLVKILEGGPRMDEAWNDARVEAGIAVGSLAYGKDSTPSTIWPPAGLQTWLSRGRFCTFITLFVLQC